jgi:hypothetical protein
LSNPGKSQSKKPNIFHGAGQRGVVAIRRQIAPESQELLSSIADYLQPELQNVGRLFAPEALGVSIIGFSRYDKRHRGIGPATKDVVSMIESCYRPINVDIGRMAIFGTNRKAKLGVVLESEDLDYEVEVIENEFEKRGFPLRKDFNSEDGFLGHCSLALLYNDHLTRFQDPRTLKKLESIAGLRTSSPQVIVLEPVKFKI